MIQRIQSVLLLLSAIILSVCLFSYAWKASANVDIYLDAFTRTVTNQGTRDEKSVIYIAGLIIAIILLTLFIIFQYKNRMLQIRLNMLSTLLICALLGVYFIEIVSAKKLFTQQINETWGAAFYLPLVSLALNIIAGRKIKKDEDLVRSVDRIR